MANDLGLTVGFPRMYNEPGERRPFLPPLMRLLAGMDVDAFVEAGCGAGSKSRMRAEFSRPSSQRQSKTA